ncbi:hypothetical protein [Flavobacterium sp. SM2513]|uniref:hypothetical protein n=1 Tax=Flavobacterium sp. SM2513 TaxID=3424766 RepID=UPI003D7FD250
MRNFIVVDNDDQESEVSNIIDKAKENGFLADGDWFDPTDSCCLTDDQKFIDMGKVVQQLNEKYHGKRIDVVLLDYALSDEKIDGVDLAIYLKQNWRNGRFNLIMYSGDYDHLMEKLEAEWSLENFKSFKKQYQTIVQYFKYFPIETFERNKKMTDALVEFLKNIRVDMEQILIDELRKYPEETFNNMHRNFNDRKLKEIVKMIENNSGEGEDFKTEIMERGIAHYIHLKD